MIKTAIGTLLMFIGTYTIFLLTEGFFYPFIAVILIGVGGSLIE